MDLLHRNPPEMDILHRNPTEKEFLRRKLLEEIAYLSTDRGRDIAMGSKKLAEKYQASDLSMEVKGLEMPAYEPRGNYGMGLAYATSERGACHLRAFTIFIVMLVTAPNEPIPFKCIACGICVKTCPVGALSIEDQPDPLEKVFYRRHF